MHVICLNDADRLDADGVSDFACWVLAPRPILGLTSHPSALLPQRDDCTSGRSSFHTARATEAHLPPAAAIRPVASRLPDWAIAHAAVAEAAAPRTVPPLWHLPPMPAAETAPPGPAVTGAQLTDAVPDSRGGPFPLAAHREPHVHPTVMLFGTNLRLVAAKAPPADTAAAAPASALRSLEDKIHELNEVRVFVI